MRRKHPKGPSRETRRIPLQAWKEFPGPSASARSMRTAYCYNARFFRRGKAASTILVVRSTFHVNASFDYGHPESEASP